MPDVTLYLRTQSIQLHSFTQAITAVRLLHFGRATCTKGKSPIYAREQMPKSGEGWRKSLQIVPQTRQIKRKQTDKKTSMKYREIQRMTYWEATDLVQVSHLIL